MGLAGRRGVLMAEAEVCSRLELRTRFPIDTVEATVDC